MTTEEKARAYDEAVKIARCWLNDPQTIQDCNYTIEDAIQNIFPQLRESEDERTRKEIIEFIRSQIEDGNSVGWDRWISYLEKQKERRDYHKLYEDIAKSEWFKQNYAGKSLGCDEEQKEQKPYEPKNWPADKDTLTQEQKPVVTHGETYRVDTLGTQQVIAGKMPQKPAEWSEKDKEMLGKVLECIRFAEDRYQLEQEETNGVSVKSWLVDHIIHQPKPAEWSEEDEKMLKCCLIAINHYEKTCNIGDHLPTKFNICGYLASVDKVKSWLKSLRPCHSWKPSDEHLSALLAIFNDPNNIGSQTCQLALTDLYEQLKKL